MARRACTLALPFLLLSAATARAQVALDQYREPAARLIGEAVSSTFAWDRLATLTDTIGNRLSGTPALDRAIAWAAAEMKKVCLETANTEKVMVPKWVRGAESAEIVS